jgi:hypothetical protein
VLIARYVMRADRTTQTNRANAPARRLRGKADTGGQQPWLLVNRFSAKIQADRSRSQPCNGIFRRGVNQLPQWLGSPVRQSPCHS